MNVPIRNYDVEARFRLARKLGSLSAMIFLARLDIEAGRTNEGLHRLQEAEAFAMAPEAEGR
jgi:hypothetical protein